MLRGAVKVALLYLSSFGIAHAESIRIWCGNDRFQIDTVRNTLQTQGRITPITWNFDGEWIRLTFSNGTDRLAFSSKNGYAIQNGKQIDARCTFRNPEALAKIEIAPTANLRLAFIGLPESSRKLIQELMSLDGYYKSRIDGLWGTGTEEALVRYKKNIEGLTEQKFLTETDFGASQYLQAIMELSYEGDECDGCEEITSSQPSFDCAEAQTADERAICATPKLMELDTILNSGFRQLVERGGQQAAQIVARNHLDRRRQCGANQSCIEQVQRETITRFIGMGSTVVLPLAANTQASAVKAPEAPNPQQDDYIKQDEANYILESITQFATESPNELTVDFVINFDRLRQANSGAWGKNKAQQFEDVLAEIGSTAVLSQRISSARASFTKEQTERMARVSAELDLKLRELKAWVLKNAISSYAPDIAQFLKSDEVVVSQGNYAELLRTSERADKFLALVTSKEATQTVAVGAAAAKSMAEDRADISSVTVKFAFLENQATLGDAFDQYSAPKGQILVPVRLIFQPEQAATSFSPTQLDIELGTETGARYPMSELATLALAAQLGIPSPLDKSTWPPGEPILLVFEAPRVNADPKEVHVKSEGYEFKLTRE